MIFRRVTRREFSRQLSTVPLLGSLVTVPTGSASSTASENTAEPADLMTQAKESQRPVSTPVSSRMESTAVQVGTTSQLLIDDYVVDVLLRDLVLYFVKE